MSEESIVKQNNSNIFGLNVALPKKTIREIKKVVKQEAEEMTVNPFLNYLEKYEKVFGGEVAEEINKCRAKIYALGQTVREGQPRSTFNVKV